MMACKGTLSLRSNPSGRITADEREIKDFPELPSATSHIRETGGDTDRVAIGIVGTERGRYSRLFPVAVSAVLRPSPLDEYGHTSADGR